MHGCECRFGPLCEYRKKFPTSDRIPAKADLEEGLTWIQLANPEVSQSATIVCKAANWREEEACASTLGLDVSD